MAERFPHLHDAHDRGIDLVLPILVDTFLRCFLLFRLWKMKRKIRTLLVDGDRCNVSIAYRLFHLNLVDLNPEEFVRKLVVELKLVVSLHFASFGNLGEHTSFAAGQRLKRAAHFTVL